MPVVGIKMREWRSGSANPCQGLGREFESRFPLSEKLKIKNVKFRIFNFQFFGFSEGQWLSW